MIDAHPGLPEFDYVRPSSVEQASKFLSEHEGVSRPFMGGTDTFVRLRDGFWKETRYLVDVKSLPGMHNITYDAQQGLTIGAAVTMNEVDASPIIREHYPVLSEAAHRVASYQLRSRATLAGNCCNASPAGDTLGACLLLGGVMVVYGQDGYREEKLGTFFKAPGRTALGLGDIAVALKFAPPCKGFVGRYYKLGRNVLSDLAIVGVTVVGYPASSASGYTFEVALASVGPKPVVVNSLLTDEPISEASIAKAAQLVMDSCNPIDDIRASARYRKYMVRNLTRRGLTEVWRQMSV